MAFRDSISIGAKEAGPILMTGDRFTTRTSKRGAVEYEFIGFLMFQQDEAFLVIRDLEDGRYHSVAYSWFQREFRQKIVRVRHKRKKQGAL